MTAAAGMMDAFSFLRAGVFTANMTGNTVVLGLGLAGHERPRAFLSLAALAAFAAGALVASLVLLRRRRESRENLRVGTGLELPFVAAVVGLSAVRLPATWEMALIATSACALGIQSVAVRRLEVSGVVTTFITGTITTAIISLVSREKAGAVKNGSQSPLLLAGIPTCYVLAAAAGGLIAPGHPVVAVLIPLSAIAAVHAGSYRG
jgi:uncharacterized membrane protein YoaK (UPF0700 family)